MSLLYPRDLPLAATHPDCTGLPGSCPPPDIQSRVDDQPGLAATLIAAAPLDLNESAPEGAFQGVCRVTLPFGGAIAFELHASVDWRGGTVRLTGLPVEPNGNSNTGRHNPPGDATSRLANQRPAPARHPRPAPPAPLTKREREVAGLLARGESNARIAELLRISPHTARRHTESVMLKLGVNARAQVGAILREAWPLRIAG